MLINNNKLSKINNYLSFGFIIITIVCIFDILTLDYFIIYLIKQNVPGESSYNLLFQLLVSIQLIISCFINEKVIDETQKLLFVLDDLNINVKDDQLYKTLISCKTSIQNLKCGLTIGGFAPWNRLTLLQVQKFK